MGLAGRKVKQRIPVDPRNLAWSENAAKFGHSYLSKLGWNPSMGLGAAGDGRTTNLAVAHKLDQLGIGANRAGPTDKDSIAWKQQNEFEVMLARLNNSGAPAEGTPSKSGAVAALGFVAPTSQPESNTEVSAWSSDAPAAESVVAESKKEKKDKKRKRKREDEADADAEVVEIPAESALSGSAANEKPPVAPPPRRFAHHRARLLHSKKIVGKSDAEIKEILGVAASSSTSTSTSAAPTPTPSDTPGTLTPISDEKITTSSTSVADYFKQKMEKMKNRHSWMAGGSTSSSTPAATEASSSTLINPFQNVNAKDHVDDDDRPRFGLGARRNVADPSTTFATSFVTSSMTSSPNSPLDNTNVTPNTVSEASDSIKDKKGKRQRDAEGDTVEEIPKTKKDKKKKDKGRSSEDEDVGDGSAKISERKKSKKRRVDAQESIVLAEDADAEKRRKKEKKKKRREEDAS